MNDSSPEPSVLPAWADEELSRLLPEIAAAGEQQDVEFKERFPDNVRDLAKEIAAFATSNDGTIILGVSDGGDIQGLPDCDTQEGRAALVQRIEGLCANVVEPTVTPELRFAVEGDQTVLAIDVKEGDAPLYYVGDIPYLRQLTAARPANPQEVIDHVTASDRTRLHGQVVDVAQSIVAEVGRVAEIAQLLKQAHQTLAVFTGGMGSSRLSMHINAIEEKEAEIAPHESEASEWLNDALELRNLSNDDLTKISYRFNGALKIILALKESLGDELAETQRQNQAERD